ncbi:MAG: hypothetical protein A2350_03510 [Candidatus Raymondbacteria bacterium RifOxyB12_full_50_8]|nr:MAG: hypothetical protein A2350_03510 [Candidatus Raymondbacteria bacterium RifOxyB12_full_50_8]
MLVRRAPDIFDKPSDLQPVQFQANVLLGVGIDDDISAVGRALRNGPCQSLNVGNRFFNKTGEFMLDRGVCA